MKTQLKNIANIKTGVYCTLGAEGNAIYLQASDLQSNGIINPNLKPNLQITGNLRNRLLNTGDIIFMAKGVNNLTLTYNRDQYHSLIPSTAFLIISNLHFSVLPEYLTWYINQPAAQQYLKGQAKGSSPPSITVKILEALEINIPPLTTQKNILKIHDLTLRQKQLKSDIERLKELILNHQLSKATKL